MRVLWVCNIMLPAIAEELGREASNKEGWLTGLSEQFLKEPEAEKIELGICFPIGAGEAPIQGKTRGIQWYGFPEDTAHPERYDVGMEETLAAVLEAFRPDIVHVFGTEFPHGLAVARCVKNPAKLLVGMQGICRACAEHYCDGLPPHIQSRSLLRDFLKQDNILQQQQKFVRRAWREAQMLRRAGHIAGRTAWDRAETEKINPEAEYHLLNETLRPVFYKHCWQPEKCEKHSIFVSQANYPIKGFHYLLEALPEIRRQFPDVKVYVAGDSVTGYHTLKEKLKIGSYGKYCLELIRRGGLEDVVRFLGKVDAEQMCRRYLDSSLFLSCSVIENSPNSVGEAMLLGMPVVSSRVGGVPSMLRDKEEGLFCDCGDRDGLVRAVCTMFTDTAFARQCGEKAREHALQTHDGKKNFARLLEIYDSMLKNSEV